MMGRQKRDGNPSPPQSKLVQDSEGNEENGYPDPDSNKQRYTIPRNPTSTQEHSERRNPASNP
jgi:hypothetical protein